MPKTILASLLAAVCGAAAARAQEWPRYAGPNGDFSVPRAPAAVDWSNTPPRCVWRVPLSDNGYACPSVAGGAVFITDHEGSNDVVRALELADGRERWRFAYPDPVAPRNGYARAAPTCEEGRVYALSRLGHLHCLDARTGERIWQTHCVRDFNGQHAEHFFCAPPAVAGERLFLCTGGAAGCVVALNKHTGGLLWRGGPPDPAGQALPVVVRLGNREVLLAYSSKALLALDPATGQTLWTVPRPTPFGNNIAQPLLLGDRLLISSGDGGGTALLSVTDTRAAPVWETREYHTLFATPVVVGDLLFLSSNTRRQGLVCAELSTGRVHWINPRFDKYTTLLRAGDRLLALEAAKGDLVVLAPSAAGCREITRFKPLGKHSWTPPLLAGDLLIVRNTAELACFQLPAAPL